MTTRAAIPIKFYTCPAPSYDEALNDCDRPILEWLLSLDPPVEPWMPQAAEIVRIDQATFAAQASAVASCEASKFASQPSPPTGVDIAVSARLAAAPGAAGESGDGLRAAVSVDFSPSVGCGTIPFQVLHRVNAVGGSYYPENTVFETDAVPPPKNGVGNFANAIVFDLVNASTAWRDYIHKVFTGGVWRIRSPKVFAHYSDWELAGDPEPGAELVARGEAFDIGRLRFELPGFPMMAETGPRWLVVHRYTHQQSNRWFLFWEWKTPLNTQNVAWSEAPDFGRSFFGNLTHKEFQAADDGDPAFFDPEGTWIHQSGVLDFAMNNVLVRTKYASVLCAETFRTVWPRSIPDVRTAGFIAPQAYFEETVEVRTIRQYKACYRITAIAAIDGFGLHITARLVNPFGFAACIVARMPFGSGSKYGAISLSNHTVVVARNLSANSESGDVNFVLPIAYLSSHPATIDYKMSDVVYDGQNGGGIVEHGFACASGAYADGKYVTAIASDASALPAAAGHKAQAWAFFNDDAVRFWSHLAAYGGNSGDVVFSFARPTPPDNRTSGSSYGGISFLGDLIITGQIYAGGWINISNYTLSVHFTAAEARARYGTYLDVSPLNAYTLGWASGYLFFESWPGGNMNECAAALLQKWIDDGKIRDITSWSISYPPLLLASSLIALDDFVSDPPILGVYSKAEICTEFISASLIRVCLR